MGLTSDQKSSLQRAGLSSTQISQVSTAIDKVGISSGEVTKIINKIVTDPRFRDEIFEDPLIAIRRSGR